MKRVLWIIVIFALLAALGVFGQRWAVESPNRTVEVVYDLPGLLELSDVTGLALPELLADLKTAGVATIAVQPQSVWEFMLQNKELPPEVLEQLPKQAGDLARFLTLPVAFSREHFELVRQAGLEASPKLNTAPWAVEPLWLESEPKLIIVSGQGTMTRDQLWGSQARLALVEFSTPLIQSLDASTMVRLHGISAPEMLVLSEERILNRYVRAVRERNLRVLYVRPFVHGDDSWERSLGLLDELEERLESAGFTLGTSLVWIAVAGAGIWAAALLYALGVFPRYAYLWMGGGILAYLVSLAVLTVAPTLAQQGLALVAAVVFPCLAVQTQWGNTPFRRYWSTAFLSLCGALLVVSVLSGTEYLIKLQEFRGVKLMHVVPIALVLFTSMRPLKTWLDKQLPVRYLIWGGALGVLGVLYVLRTGNFGVPVLNLEVQVREFLENLLRVRPRTKEFLLGHPALYFAVHSKQPQKSWWLPVAVIGQISLVNTFTHTHTFLWVSLLRTLYGLVFGYLLGWLAARVYHWGKRWLERDHGFRVLRIR